MASYLNHGSNDGNGDDTDRSLNRRMKKMGKSKPIFEESTDESDESASTEEEEETRKGERRKSRSNNSRYRSRSMKRSRGTPSGLTPKAKEARIDAEPRFSAKFDADGAIIEPSAEREAANRRARIDKEKRYIAEARPHKARSGDGGGGNLDNDWQNHRGRSTGRGRGRNEGNRTEDRNGKKLYIKHLKPNSGATNEPAAARGSNSLGDTAPASAVAQDETKTTRPMARNTSEQDGPAPPGPDNRDNSLTSKIMNHFSDKTPPVKQTSKNPNFAAMMTKARARAEEVVYVFSGLEDQLPLTQTQFELIIVNIMDQALTLQIKREPAPEFKFQQYSRANDKGFIGVDSPAAADLIVKAIARITIKGVKFRGWRAAEMKVKHLVTVEISELLAKCGVAKIVEAMIKRNDLRGEAISAWIDPHANPRLRVFKYFADDTLYRELLLRRNGPLGADQGWNIMLWVGSQHSKAHISQPLEITTTAVAEADQLKADRERERVAAETDKFLAKAKATTAAANDNAANASANASTSANANASTSANAKPTPNIKAKIEGYLDEKKLRAAALAAEEEAAEAERILNEPKAMDETNNASLKLTTSWADDDPPSPLTQPTS
jgi:hypothetical protein